MILDETIKIKWNNGNKKNYVDKGYLFTKYDDEFEVKIEDLSSNSHVKINVKCDRCTNTKNIQVADYTKNIKNCGYYACCNKCAKDKYIKTINDKSIEEKNKIQEKTIETCLKKYGVKYISQDENIRNKVKKTNIKNCGFECNLKSNETKTKILKTNLIKYGTENPTQNEKVKEKRKNTCLKKYNVEFVSQDKGVIEKRKETCLKKYGTEYALQSTDVIEKRKETCLKKYGTEYALQNIDVIEKRKQTNLIRYGVENTFQNEKIKEKIKETNLIRYGVEYSSQRVEIIEKQINTCIERYGESWSNHIPKHNPNSIIYLDLISEKISIIIQHALNDGEKKFRRYWVDGYIEQYNICIEWNEKHHYYKKQLEKDILREKYIIDNFKCKFFKIKEEDFLKDIDNNIDLISNEILDYINCLKNH